jgi:hypothetical protein
MAAKRINIGVTVWATKPTTLLEQCSLTDRLCELTDVHDIEASNVTITEDGDTLSYDWLVKV